MLFAPEDQVYGVPAAVAREAVRIVESVQWCSAGVLARELRIDITASRCLLQALESDGRLTRYPGMLPSGHDGAWLPGEEASEEPLVLWHLRYPEGKALAKARIGPAVPRSVAESLLAEFLDRIRSANNDPAGSHVIERVTLFGSLTDPGRRRSAISTSWSTPEGAPEAPARKKRAMSRPLKGRGSVAGGCPEEEAAGLRMGLEGLLRAGDERIDASVIDESSDDPRPLPDGAVEIEVFRREVPPSGTIG